MKLESRVKAFHELGRFLTQFSQFPPIKDESVLGNEHFFDKMTAIIQRLDSSSGWFREPMLRFAFASWSKELTVNKLNAWISNYNFKDIKSGNVAVIMAGNVPLVGLHDLISILICGHNALIKLSSKDNLLIPFLVEYLSHIEPEFDNRISFISGTLKNHDAVIATGSDNTARYFEYYFRDCPSIIRKNRNSVAVLSGTETEEELKELSNDIFIYYGLGCRNVSKLYVPEGYDFDQLFKAVYHWHHLIEDQKYANNYDYNKAVFLMSEFDILENGFLMLKEDDGFASPIATLFYEYYNSKSELKNALELNAHKIQCIVGDKNLPGSVAFGHTQLPSLTDYADGVDTVDFLLKI